MKNVHRSFKELRLASVNVLIVWSTKRFRSQWLKTERSIQSSHWGITDQRMLSNYENSCWLINVLIKLTVAALTVCVSKATSRYTEIQRGIWNNALYNFYWKNWMCSQLLLCFFKQIFLLLINEKPKSQQNKYLRQWTHSTSMSEYKQ